jgi:hypothetical protein
MPIKNIYKRADRKIYVSKCLLEYALIAPSSCSSNSAYIYIYIYISWMPHSLVLTKFLTFAVLHLQLLIQISRVVPDPCTPPTGHPLEQIPRRALLGISGIMPGSLRDRELAAGARIVSRIPISAEPLPIVTGRSFVMVGAGK